MSPVTAVPETRYRDGRATGSVPAMTEQTAVERAGDRREQESAQDRESGRERRAEIRRLGAKYAECHAELLRRLGE